MAPIVNLKGKSTISSSVSVSSALRKNFSHHHIQCAWICTKNSIEIENKHKEGSKWEENAPLYREDVAFVSGAIITSVAYLEASINEFFNDCENDSKNIETIGKPEIQTLKNKWNTKQFQKNAGVITKYQTAYGIIKKKGIDKTLQLFKDLEDLIKLRNKLVHYQSIFQSDDEESDPYGLNHLHGKFKENVFMEKAGNPFFPYKCLGTGCARWAIKTSIEFTDFFYSEINIKKTISDHNLVENL